MNADQLKGQWLRFNGDPPQKRDKFIENDVQEIRGNYDKFLGKVQERYGNKKSELMKWANQWRQKPRRKLWVKTPADEWISFTNDD